MQLKKFKKVVLDYFEFHTAQRRKALKKTFTIVKAPPVYCCVFAFRGTPMRLLYYIELQKWILEPFSVAVPEERKFTEGDTIEQCCDILWRTEHDKQAITRIYI